MEIFLIILFLITDCWACTSSNQVNKITTRLTTVTTKSTTLTTIPTTVTTKPTTATTNPTTIAVYNGSCPLGFSFDGKSCIECGLSDYTQNVRIVGGIEATPYSVPSQIMIIQSYYSSSMLRTTTYLCGGTLIRPNVVLTAAHCLNTKFSNGYGGQVSFIANQYYPTYESTFDVYAAIHDKSFFATSWNPPAPGVRCQVKQAIKHQLYSSTTLQNDIALLILDRNITLNSYVKLACLPSASNSFPPENQNVYASGWGTLSSGGSIPNKLYNVKLTNYNSTMCSNVFPTISKNWNSQICAGEYAGGKDTCQGDSGGPLMYRETISGKEKMFVAGITSYGDSCALARKPGIYTRTSNYISWILSNL